MYVVVRLCTAGLGEFKIRDMNDEINKLLREKRHWEYRIRELGGSDYKVGTRVVHVVKCRACQSLLMARVR